MRIKSQSCYVLPCGHRDVASAQPASHSHAIEFCADFGTEQDMQFKTPGREAGNGNLVTKLFFFTGCGNGGRVEG
jgi:hypothetical protein